jgi:hypothetical protein
VLSDCVLLLEAPDGAVTPVLDDRLARLPRALLRSDVVVDTRVRNKEGGFFTAAADPAVAARAVTGTLPRDRVRALAGLSDGAARWTEMFHEGDWTDLFGLVREEGARALVRRVRERERADRDGRAFLGRGKIHDDATVVLARL